MNVRNAYKAPSILASSPARAKRSTRLHTSLHLFHCDSEDLGTGVWVRFQCHAFVCALLKILRKIFTALNN